MTELQHGGVYLVRWNFHPDQPLGIARYFSDVDDPARDADEEPRVWWEFFAVELTAKPEEYDVVARVAITCPCDDYEELLVGPETCGTCGHAFDEHSSTGLMSSWACRREVSSNVAP